MTDLISQALPLLTLVSHFLFFFLIISIFFRRSWGRNTISWLGKHSENLTLIVSLAAVFGSLFYSNIVGFPPCVLCWWQRVFLFPIPVILIVGRIRKDLKVMDYVVPLALASAVIALYQSYVYLGGSSILPCTAEGGDCSRIYVMAYGYITIPLMSFTISAYLVILSWFKKFYV